MEVKMKKILCLLCMLMFIPAICYAVDVSISWNASEGATGYKIYYGQESGVYGQPLDVGDVVTYLRQNFPTGGYYFALTAYNEFGESDFSDEVFVNILGHPTSITVTFNPHK